MKLLVDNGIEHLAWSNVEMVECPQCGNGGYCIKSRDWCQCLWCDYEWDRIDVRGPVVIVGSDPWRIRYEH